jgi:Tol biopolymer transport system component
MRTCKSICGLNLALLFVLLYAIVPFALHVVDAQNTARAIQPQAYFTEPTLSPDRKEIAFVSGGDIWTVPATGGVAALLVSHPANEARPLYSPDGKELAFVSSRTGNGDIYIITLATGDLRRITFDDGYDSLDSWSRDGKWLYFSSTSRDIGGLNDLFRVSPAGGTPMQVSADRYTNEFYSSPSPDGNTIAFTARGISSGQWWRRGHSHIDEAEIWLLTSFDSGSGSYQRVTEEASAKEMWPMWNADGRTLFYVSDRADNANKNGAQNVWSLTPESLVRVASQISMPAGCCGRAFHTTDARSFLNTTFGSGS